MDRAMCICVCVCVFVCTCHYAVSCCTLCAQEALVQNQKAQVDQTIYKPSTEPEFCHLSNEPTTLRASCSNITSACSTCGSVRLITSGTHTKSGAFREANKFRYCSKLKPGS